MSNETPPPAPMERYIEAKRYWITYIVCAGIITIVALPFAFAYLSRESWFGPVLFAWVVAFLVLPGYLSFRQVDRLYALAYPESDAL